MEISQRAVKELIKQFTGQAQILSIPRPYIRFTGDHECALMLNQIIYWSDRTDDPDGWFYKTHDDWAEELELTPSQIRRITKVLEGVGVEVKLKKHNGAPKLHYRINDDIFYEKFFAFLKERGHLPRVRKRDNQQTSQSDLSDPTVNIPDNQQSPLSDNAESADSDNQRPSLSSNDPKITSETTQRLHTHTVAPTARAPSNGNGRKACVCSTPHKSKLCDEERIQIARNMIGVNSPERYAMTLEARRGTYDATFIQRQKELKKPGAVNLPERDKSACPDCTGLGFWYPGGPEKGVVKCLHPRLGSVVESMMQQE